MQIQISLIIGNLYLADLITGISSIKSKKRLKEDFFWDRRSGLVHGLLRMQNM